MEKGQGEGLEILDAIIATGGEGGKIGETLDEHCVIEGLGVLVVVLHQSIRIAVQDEGVNVLEQGSIRLLVKPDFDSLNLSVKYTVFLLVTARDL